MADLAAFLDRASRTPFVFGTFDCGLWLADWLVESGHSDPAADLRGAYSDQAGCDAVLAAAGGLDLLVQHMARRAGLDTAEPPGPGAVGTVWVPTFEGRAVAGAICTGQRWAILTVGGLMSAPAQPIAAWMV